MPYTNIDDPSAHFQTATYTGAGANQTVTNDGNSDLQPDWLWIKRRNAGYAHALFDSNRGLGSSNPPMLESDSTAAENSNQNWISGVGTDSFTIGINEQNLSNTSGTYVAWQWKANGGTTASNTDGSITSTVQANQDAGFSIVTYAGTGVYNKTVGHGLGVAPAVVILKNRTTGEASYDDWWVYHKDTSNPVNRGLRLNENGAEQSTTVLWSVVPSSTIFGVGGSVDAPRYTNGASQNYVAYCFAEKQGYSKFGKYVGNGNANGPFVYTGFKPAFLMMKRTDSTGNWVMFDNKRDLSNVTKTRLFPNLTNADNTTRNYVDLLSNGFKLRDTDVDHNASGATIIFMAFAENPFVTSTGVPTTAR
jgi:hypothetical protein